MKRIASLNKYKQIVQNIYSGLSPIDWSKIIKYKYPSRLCQKVLMNVLADFKVEYQKPEDIEYALDSMEREAQKKFLDFLVSAIDEEIHLPGSRAEPETQGYQRKSKTVIEKTKEPASIVTQRASISKRGFSKSWAEQTTFEDVLAGNREPSEDSSEYFLGRDDE